MCSPLGWFCGRFWTTNSPSLRFLLQMYVIRCCKERYKNSHSLKEAVDSHHNSFQIPLQRPPIPATCERYLAKLMQMCWKADHRVSSKNLVWLGYFNTLYWLKLNCICFVFWINCALMSVIACGKCAAPTIAEVWKVCLVSRRTHIFT